MTGSGQGFSGPPHLMVAARYSVPLKAGIFRPRSIGKSREMTLLVIFRPLDPIRARRAARAARGEIVECEFAIRHAEFVQREDRCKPCLGDFVAALDEALRDPIRRSRVGVLAGLAPARESHRR